MKENFERYLEGSYESEAIRGKSLSFPLGVSDNCISLFYALYEYEQNNCSDKALKEEILQHAFFKLSAAE